MKNRQRGMTFLGLVTILLILGTAVYAALRLVPVYAEYMEVARALEQVKDEHGAIDTTAQMIRNSLERHWDVEDINGISWKDIGIKKIAEGFEVSAIYQVESPFIANVSLLTKFNKTVIVPQ